MVYAVVSTDNIQIPPGSMMRIPGSWSDFCQLRDSRGDGSIPRYVLVQEKIDICFATAKEKGTGTAISELRRSM